MLHKTAELLTAVQVMQILNVSRYTFYGNEKRGVQSLRIQLLTKGLKVVKMPSSRTRYLASSLYRIINFAASREAVLA